MKSLRRAGIAGNAKLRGKLGKVLSCGCCDLHNFKPQYRWQQAGTEIKNFNARPIAAER